MKKLIVHVDANKTILISDLVKNETKEMVLMIELSADQSYRDCWEDCKEELTYYEYCSKYKYPNYKSDPEQRRARKEDLSKFLTYLEDTKHNLYKEVSARFNKLNNKLSCSNRKVLPSFYNLLEYLEQQQQLNRIQYKIIIRTFGQDLPLIIKELHKHTNMKFVQGSFNQGKLSFNNTNNPQEIYKYLTSQDSHIAIWDDWQYWAKNGRKCKYGKLYPLDVNSCDEISIFLDDNITSNPDINIIAPYDIKNKTYVSPKDILEQYKAYIVSPLAAIDNDDYYIDLVKQSLAYHNNAVNKKQFVNDLLASNQKLSLYGYDNNHTLNDSIDDAVMQNSSTSQDVPVKTAKKGKLSCRFL